MSSYCYPKGPAVRGSRAPETRRRPPCPTSIFFARATRCSAHSKGISLTHFSSERLGPCLPSRIASVISGAKKAKGRFDKQGISFVSVTQQFNTTTSMGRLTLNVLLSFAQFEREVTGERSLRRFGGGSLLKFSAQMASNWALFKDGK